MVSVFKFFSNIFRFKRGKKAENTIIANAMLAGAVIALGFVTLTWTYQQAQVANMEYAATIDSQSSKIKEKLVIEYTCYNQTDGKLFVYLLNCGQSNSVDISNICISNSSWTEIFQIEELKLFNGTSISTLNIHEHCYFDTLISLLAGIQYSLKITTERGCTFETVFSY